MLVCNLASAFALALGLVLGLPVVADFLRTGVVDRFPTAILAATLVMIAVLMLGVGMILNGVLRGRQETRRLFYLQLPATPHR